MEALEAVGKEKLSAVNEKGFVPDEVRDTFFRKLRMKSENRSCFECPNRNPTWISLTYGIYLCLECSGEHRRKGVHISFVRSVELDSFAPEQMVQMAAGGNGKALDFFKGNEMGKLSSSGRPVDYTSKVAQRYKAQLDAEAKKLCEKYNVSAKSSQVKFEVKPEEADFGFDAPTKVPSNTLSAPSPKDAGYPEEEVLQRGKSAPAVVTHTKPSAPSVPHSHVVRKADPAVIAAKPTGFVPGGKQMAKEIDFDFDFDDLETEASKPKPAPAPAPAAPTPAPAPAPVPAVRVQSAGAEQNGANKFANRKGISSSDFFNEMEPESAQQRLDRENRFNKFAAAGAISSASYFGDGDEDIQNNTEDISSLASLAAGRGAEMARTGFAKGAEMLTEYLAKVRD